MSDSIRAGRRTVTVSNRNKVLFPEDGITKGDLFEYYAAVAIYYLFVDPTTRDWRVHERVV